MSVARHAQVVLPQGTPPDPAQSESVLAPHTSYIHSDRPAVYLDQWVWIRRYPFRLVRGIASYQEWVGRVSDG